MVQDKQVWPHPAKSGYEFAKRAEGQRVDPEFRKYGRGGAVPGYDDKLTKVEELRRAYFKEMKIAPKSYFEDIDIVPTDWLNDRLAAEGIDWRVRIVDEDEYEFYLPG